MIIFFSSYFYIKAALERHRRFLKSERPKGHEFMTAFSYGSNVTNDEV